MEVFFISMAAGIIVGLIFVRWVLREMKKDITLQNVFKKMTQAEKLTVKFYKKTILRGRTDSEISSFNLRCEDGFEIMYIQSQITKLHFSESVVAYGVLTVYFINGECELYIQHGQEKKKLDFQENFWASRVLTTCRNAVENA